MQKQSADASSGARALVLEDGHWIADDLRDSLERLGMDVLGPFADVGPALDALREGPLPTVAVLDVRLRDGDSFEVADLLDANGIPYVFHTGYARGVIPARYGSVRIFEKPIQAARLATVLAELSSGGGAEGHRIA